MGLIVQGGTTVILDTGITVASTYLWLLFKGGGGGSNPGATGKEKAEDH